jgi:8-oxo-dGTP pyrophosphatase MutT (NUDIX family)
MLNNQTIKDKLRLALSSELPGMISHLQLAPKERVTGIKEQKSSKNAKLSAVLLIMFKENKQLKIVFILRSVYDGVHSGQISFPGGKKDENDKDSIETALREAKEEVGIAIERKDILGKLTNLYIPNSNFIVEPYVAFVEKLNGLIPDQAEVQEIYRILLKDVLDKKAIQSKEVLFLNKRSILAPCFYINELKIWGATAMILNELVDIIKTNGLTKDLA